MVIQRDSIRNRLLGSRTLPWMEVGVLLCILVVGVFFRFHAPLADPMMRNSSGASFIDECWFHQARNIALYGTFKVPGDHWDTSLVSYPGHLLVALSFELLGVSLRSLRLPAQLSGVFVMVLIGGLLFIATRRWAVVLHGTALASLSYALIAYSRVSIIEPYLLLTQVIWLVVAWQVLRNGRGSLLLGLASVLALATKLSAILFLVPAIFALCCARALHSNPAALASWQGHLKQLVLYGCGSSLGILVYWAVVIRPFPGRWWALNISHFGVGRSSSSWVDIWGRFVGLSSQSDGLLLISGPLVLATGIAFIGLLPHFLAKPKDPALALSVWCAGACCCCLAIAPLMDIAGRRLIHIVPLAILAVAAGTVVHDDQSPVQKSPLVFGGALLVALPTLHHGLSGTIMLLNGMRREIFGVTAWYKPIWSLKVTVLSIMVTGGVLVALYLLKERWFSFLQKGLIGIFLCSNLLAIALYMANLDHSFYRANLAAAAVLSDDAVVLSNNACHLSWEGKFFPVFTYPGIRYANDDETALKEWGAEYALFRAKNLYKVGDTFDHPPEHSAFWREYSDVAAVFYYFDYFSAKPHNAQREMFQLVLLKKGSEKN